jgi:predicted RND superfamily exporter protein
MLFGLQFPRITIDTDPENMLEEDQPDRVFYNEIKSIFRIRDLLVVGITDHKSIFRPLALERVDRIISEILKIDGVVVQDVISLTTSNNPISEEPGHITINRVMREVPKTPQDGQRLFEEIIDNWCLEERLVSRDGKSTAIYIPIERKDMSRRIAVKIEEILNQELLPGQTYHFAGLPIAEDTFGYEMFIQMGVVAPLAFMFIMILVYLLFRQPIFLIPIGMDAMFTVMWAMGLLIGTGHTVHIMSSMIPVFLMPIAILDDCHVLSEFFDRFRMAGDRRRALVEAYQELYRPMFQTSVTSAAGFLSLALTPIPPVRVFGLFVAFGVMVAWLLSMTVVPAVITLMNEDKLKKALSARNIEKAPFLDRILRLVGQTAFFRSRLVLLGAMGAVVIGISGVARIEVNDNPVKWFKESHQLRKADDFMNEHFGGTYMAYLVAEGKEAGAFKQPEVLRYVERLQAHLKEENVVGMTTSLPDPIKRLNQALHDFDEEYIRIPDSREAVGQLIFLCEIGGDPNDLALCLDQERRRSLIWIQMKKGDNKFMHGVETRVSEFMQSNPPPDGILFRWSGLTYINKVWQELMVGGMFKALLGAAAVVLILMLIEFRSWILGLLSMLPLTLAILISYGLAGWIGKDYDMPIAVCSTLTLGMAIDFAIHYIQRWRLHYRRTQNLEEAHSYMFGDPGRAILRNAIVIALGFLPLMLSNLLPYVTVGIFFALLMLISTLTTLLVLPAALRYLGPRLLKGGL